MRNRVCWSEGGLAPSLLLALSALSCRCCCSSCFWAGLHSRLCCLSLLRLFSALLLGLSTTTTSSSSPSPSSSVELWIHGRLRSCSSASLLSSLLPGFPACFSLRLSSFFSCVLLSGMFGCSSLCSSCCFACDFFCGVFAGLASTGGAVAFACSF